MFLLCWLLTVWHLNCKHLSSTEVIKQKPKVMLLKNSKVLLFDSLWPGSLNCFKSLLALCTFYFSKITNDTFYHSHFSFNILYFLEELLLFFKYSVFFPKLFQFPETGVIFLSLLYLPNHLQPWSKWKKSSLHSHYKLFFFLLSLFSWCQTCQILSSGEWDLVHWSCFAYIREFKNSIKY